MSPARPTYDSYWAEVRRLIRLCTAPAFFHGATGPPPPHSAAGAIIRLSFVLSSPTTPLWSPAYVFPFREANVVVGLRGRQPQPLASGHDRTTQRSTGRAGQDHRGGRLHSLARPTPILAVGHRIHARAARTTNPCAQNANVPGTARGVNAPARTALCVNLVPSLFCACGTDMSTGGQVRCCTPWTDAYKFPVLVVVGPVGSSR